MSRHGSKVITPWCGYGPPSTGLALHVRQGLKVGLVGQVDVGLAVCATVGVGRAFSPCRAHLLEILWGEVSGDKIGKWHKPNLMISKQISSDGWTATKICQGNQNNMHPFRKARTILGRTHWAIFFLLNSHVPSKKPVLMGTSVSGFLQKRDILTTQTKKLSQKSS